MRVWCYLPCFSGDEIRDNLSMEGDKIGQNHDINDRIVDNNTNEGDKFREGNEEGLKLGFSLELPGVKSSNSNFNVNDKVNNVGGLKRDVEGVLVERETSVFEASELSIGGSSSRISPQFDAFAGFGLSCNAGSSSSFSSIVDEGGDNDLQHKRVKVESSSRECRFATERSPCADDSVNIIKRCSSSGNYIRETNKDPCLLSVEDYIKTIFHNKSQDTVEDDIDTSDIDSMEIQMDLSDDLLHTVFTFLGHRDLCQAAMVCKQWRAASAHEDLWRCLDFENRNVSVAQLEDVCQRYPRATEVNLCGNPDMHMLVMRAISLLRNLEALTIGKGKLGETFFHALSECPLLRKLVVCDAYFGKRVQEISINHDRLQHLEVRKCRLLRVSLSCPQLDTLSLKRSNMSHVVLNCPLLRSLDIGSCHKLLEPAIRSAVISCPLLEYLDMSNCSFVIDETLREVAQTCANLRELNASYCPNISLESVRMPLLTVLRLESCEGITSASMTAIAYSGMLEILELDNCYLLASVFLELPHLRNLRLVHCRTLVDLNLRCLQLSTLTVSNCPALHRINITSNALKKLLLPKQESLNSLSLQCQYLEEVDLADCEALTNSVCDVFCDGGGCPMLKSLVLDNCESLTAVRLCSTSIVSLSLAGCRLITTLNLTCPYLEQVRLDGCYHIERASFLPVGLHSLNLGICPKLNALHVEAPCMVGLELKGCGFLSEASIDCPLLKFLDASFCSQLEDEFLSETTSSCPLIEKLILMSCNSIGSDGLSFLRCLRNLTYLDLSYTFLMDLGPIFSSCLRLTVLKLQACKYLHDSSLEALYRQGALPTLCELDLSYGALCQSAIEELLAVCTHLTHLSLNGCTNMYDLNWGLTGLSSFQASGLVSNQRLKEPLELPHRILQNFNCVGCPNIKKVYIPSTAQCTHLLSVNLSLSSNLKEVDVACPNLCFLNLSNCSSLEILKLECPKLTILFLQSCNIDEEAVESAISRCGMLETLDVRFCPKISGASMGRLRALYPSLKRIFCSRLP